MTEDEIKKEVWETVQALNKLWAVDGKVDGLNNYFHSDMVAITPTDRERLEGKDKCIGGWEAFLEVAKVNYMKEIDPKIQLYCGGMTAVVTYYYDMSVEMGGRTVELGGRDMFVLVNEDGKWLVVADQFSPYPQEGRT